MPESWKFVSELLTTTSDCTHAPLCSFQVLFPYIELGIVLSIRLPWSQALGLWGAVRRILRYEPF